MEEVKEYTLKSGSSDVVMIGKSSDWSNLIPREIPPHILNGTTNMTPKKKKRKKNKKTTTPK